MTDHAKRLRGNCSCNFSSTPCGAEEECRNALEGADHIEKLEAAVKKVLSQCSWYRSDQWCADINCRCIVLVSAMQEELNTSQERVNKTGET